MFVWILIIFALAMIFGVVKVEKLKDWWVKALAFIKESINKGLPDDDSDNSDQK